MTTLDALLHAASSRGWTFAPQQLHHWYATLPSSGQITGVIGSVTLWATDGNCGLFDTTDNYTFKGHIQHFSGSVEPLIKSGPTGLKSKPAPDDTTGSDSTSRWLRKLNAQIYYDKYKHEQKHSSQ